ncbi:MAG: protein kinase [Lysobacterales bacterium]
MENSQDKWDQLLVTGGGLLADDEADDENWSGQTLGAFELIERIAVGGMASVYRGQRTNQFEQQVAVKVMSAALKGNTHQQRFVRERQILANLDHPAIARIIDGGVVGERPYLVMELVTGRAIDEYCELHQPGVVARLRMLAKVAAAVEHAHNQGVIHQDLKPGNVLVTADAEPKLLDFGISDLAEAEDGHEHLMTPAFAAPEQFAGGEISAATDVFQMGLLIARVVTNKHPLLNDANARMDVIRQQMMNPGVNASIADSIPAQQRGDFLHVVRRCLEVDPRKRYPTMDALGRDLGALANGEVLPTRAKDTAYRLRKAAGNRRLELSAAAAIIAGAMVVGGMVWRQIEQQKAEVAASGETAVALGEVVTDILATMDPLENGNNGPIDDVISVSNFEKMVGATRNNPQVQRGMIVSSGRALLDAGKFREVVDLVEPVVVEMADEEPKPPRYGEFLSLLGYARYREGDVAEGLAELREALVLQTAQSTTLAPAVRALTFQRLAMAERRAANIQDAHQHIQQALVLLPAQATFARQRAQAQSQQGLILTDLGDLDAALQAFEQSIESLGGLSGDNAIRRAMTLSNMADTLRLKGDLDQAQAHAQSAVELLADTTDNPQLLATASTTLGNVLMTQTQFAAAADQYQVALGAYRSEFGDNHPRVALVAHNLGTALRLAGDCAKAIEYYDLAVKIAAQQYSPQHPELLESRRQRALCQP